MSSTFWNRYVELEIGDIVIRNSDLDIYFKVENSTGEEAGSAEITIYNLAEATRQKFKPEEQVVLKAGYQGDYGIIFSGTIQEVEDEYQGADVATIIYAQDDTTKLLKTEINLKYPAGTTLENIAKSLFHHANIPVGRVESTGLSLASTWVTGKRTVADALKYLVGEIDAISGKNFNYYVKNGAGYFVEENTQYEEAFVLSAETGLMEVQKIDKEDGEADYRLRTLMLWKITQDSLLDLDSIKVKGLFRVVSYKKVAREEEYYCEMEVRAV